MVELEDVRGTQVHVIQALKEALHRRLPEPKEIGPGERKFERQSGRVGLQMALRRHGERGVKVSPLAKSVFKAPDNSASGCM